MNTTTLLESPPAGTVAPAGGHRGRVTLVRVIRSEWIKLRSLRSTVITVLAAVVMVIGLGLLFAAVVSGDIGGGDGDGPGGPGGGPLDPFSVSLGGVSLGQLIIGVLGVLLIAGEYSTGMIRSSLAAVPRRLPVLWAKAVVFAAVALVTMSVAVLVAFLGGQAIIGTDGVAITDDGVFRALLGAAGYLVGVGLLGMALGSILRNTGAAIAALFGLVLIVPGLFQLLPASWNDTLGPYLPSNAGGSLMAVTTPDGMLGPWAGLAVFAGYLVVAFGAAAILLRRRDA